METRLKHEALVQREILSWLDDDDQLAELGSRCVAAMVGHRRLPDGADETSLPNVLRALLADDWLAGI